MDWSKKDNRKGQLHITETVAVLFIFFILIMFGIIFYYKYQQVSLKEKSEELLQSRAVDVTLKTLFLPELLCTRGEAEPEDNCIDMLKLAHANNTMARHLTDYYFNLFSYARIYVTEIYPQNNPPDECLPGSCWILYDKQKPDVTKEEATHFIVTLRDDKAGPEPQYRFGYVSVVVYS